MDEKLTKLKMEQLEGKKEEVLKNGSRTATCNALECRRKHEDGKVRIVADYLDKDNAVEKGQEFAFRKVNDYFGVAEVAA
ncbi:MAG: hypothetical protein CMH63_01705 [Nanoarchaeota archaeon]|nr:hypothetical protein [Nanoarchaeota archaeon]